jgi:hypothetical protein
MNASMPSSVHPPQAAQNPLIWFELSLLRVVVATGATACTMNLFSEDDRTARHST